MNTALVERHLFQRNKMRHDIDSEGILAQVTSSDPNSLCQALLCGSSMATEHTAAKSCTVCLHFQRRPSCESLWYPIRRNRPKNHFWTPNPSGSLEIFNLWNCSRHMVWIWGESSVPALKPFAWNFTSATLGSTICPGTARNLYAQIVLSINFRTPKPKMWTSYIFWMPQHTLQPAAPPTGGVGGHFGAIRIYLRNVETKFATPITGLGSYYKVTRNNVNNTNKMHGATAILGRNYAKWQGAPRCRPTSSSRDLAI